MNLIASRFRRLRIHRCSQLGRVSHSKRLEYRNNGLSMREEVLTFFHETRLASLGAGCRVSLDP